jgi:multidrug efflux system outer membrane protein
VLRWLFSVSSCDRLAGRKRGVADNKDLKIAAARVDHFLGQFVTTRAGLFPQASAGFDAQRQRSSQSGPLPLPAGVSPVYNDFQQTLSASWEIDLFGKVRRETEAAGVAESLTNR